MAVSTVDLEEMEDRVSQILGDASNATYSTADVDSAIRMALHKMNELKPREITDVVDAETREFDISAVDVLDPSAILHVWAPYDASDTDAAPDWRAFEAFVYNDTLYVRLLGGADASAGDSARIVYQQAHTVDGLDSASATTFYASLESAFAKGAAAFALRQRSGGLSESATKGATSTPNQGTLADLWMKEFLDSLAPRATGVSAHPAWSF